MKKISFMFIPLMAAPLFVGCNKGLGDPKPLNECSWDKINEVSKAGKASEWFKIGDETTVTVNGQPHKVRIIGFNHDVDAKGNKIGITFEFVNLISDEDGYSLASIWNWDYNEMDYPNEDFPNSSLRKALDGGGNGSIAWYRKSASTKSTDTAYTKPVLEMLPKDLQNVLKETVKPIALYEEDKFVVNTTDYKTKLFPLSYCEMAKDKPKDIDVLDEGTIYEYYEINDSNSARIHKQVKGDDVCTEGTKITDAVIEHGIPTQNYAGFNFKADETGGGVSWLRSPTAAPQYWAISNQSTGKLTDSIPDMNIFAVAPAFCI